MKRPRLLIGILVGLHVVLVVLILWRYPMPGPNDVGPLDLSLFMLLPSQGNLLGFWTALGGKRTPWRVVSTVIGMVVCLVVWDRFAYRHFVGEAVLPFVWQTVNVSVLLLLARMAGLKLIHAGSEPVERELGRFQFSLWQLLTWTTVFGVILSAIHYLPDGLQLNFQFNPIVAKLAVSLGSVALASVWLAFGRKWLTVRIILLVVMAIGLGTAMPLWHSTPGPLVSWAYSCFLLFAEAAWTTASLLVVRLAGYQLTWR